MAICGKRPTRAVVWSAAPPPNYRPSLFCPLCSDASAFGKCKALAKSCSNCFAKVRIYRIVGGQHPPPAAAYAHPIHVPAVGVVLRSRRRHFCPAPGRRVCRASLLALGRRRRSLPAASWMDATPAQIVPTPMVGGTAVQGRELAAPLPLPTSAPGRVHRSRPGTACPPAQLRGGRALRGAATKTGRRSRLRPLILIEIHAQNPLQLTACANDAHPCAPLRVLQHVPQGVPVRDAPRPGGFPHWPELAMHAGSLRG